MNRGYLEALNIITESHHNNYNVLVTLETMLVEIRGEGW